MTEAELFKHMAAQSAESAGWFRRHFNCLAVTNVCSAVWQTVLGVIYAHRYSWPWNLVGVGLFICGCLAVALAAKAYLHGRMAYQAFMKLRADNLKIAAELS